MEREERKGRKEGKEGREGRKLIRGGGISKGSFLKEGKEERLN